LDNDLDSQRFAQLLERKKKADEQDKFRTLVGGFMDTIGNSQGAGNYWLGKMRPQSNAGANMARSLSSAESDPLQEEQKRREFMAQSQDARMKKDMMNPESDLSQKKAEFYSKVLGPKLGGTMAGMSAEQMGKAAPMLAQRMQAMESQAFSREMADKGFQNQLSLANAKMAHSNQLAQRKATVEKEKEMGELEIEGLGYARNKEDAKALKSASESKEKLDRQLSEMIQLRKDYGGEVLNRDAVARGKQLSKDILLAYKNLAKLGVLSKADEDIINAIIPADPLGFTPFSAMTGQDPIMSQLTKFQGDLNTDYANTVKMRLQDGQSASNKLMAENMQKDLEGQQMGKGELVPSAVANEEKMVKMVNGKMYYKVEGGWKALK